MNKIEVIKTKTFDLIKYADAYYNKDAPIISDKQYDELYDELFKLEEENNFHLASSPTRKVQGSILEGLKKVEHSKPMLSAAKTKDVNEIKKFINGREFYCSYKLDGLTMVCRYKNGKFVQAITRGTGTVGEDVTEQAKFISNLPMTIAYDGDLELRGECVISWDQFNKVNTTLEEPYSHPRNLAAGTLRSFDTNIVRDRKLSYIVFECVTDLIHDDNVEVMKESELKWLAQIGFDVVDTTFGTVEDCIEKMKPEYYPYPVDGLIFEFNHRAYSKSLQATNHHEGCRMAFKWIDNTYETTLLDVEWNPTRTGLISPVAVFSEVDLDGALTTRATLHNVSIIEQLELGIGDTITVYRSNMVIPKIDENLTRSGTLAIPKICPCCGQPTIIQKTENSKVLVCTNPNCQAKKIAQFENFVSRKAMNIDGLSTETLTLLINNGYINDFIDIYGLFKHRDKLVTLPGLGRKSVEKLLLSIENSRNVKLNNYIVALGIPNVGVSAAKAIAEHFDYDYFAFEDAMNDGFDWTQLPDFGKKTSDGINKWWKEQTDTTFFLPTELIFERVVSNVVNNNPFTEKVVVITGKLNHFTRDSINEKIASLGAKTAGSVSKKTDYLITNEASGSSKYKKAIEFGVPVITEDEFLKMIGE